MHVLVHHNSHTNNSICLSRPPALTSPSLHHQQPRTQSSASHRPITTHINHHLLTFSAIFSLPTHIPPPNPHHIAPIGPPVIWQVMPEHEKAVWREALSEYLVMVGNTSGANTTHQDSFCPQYLTTIWIFGPRLLTTFKTLDTHSSKNYLHINNEKNEHSGCHAHDAMCICVCVCVCVQSKAGNRCMATWNMFWYSRLWNCASWRGPWNGDIRPVPG